MKWSTAVMWLLGLAIIVLCIVGYFTAAFPSPFPAWHRATSETPATQTSVVNQPTAQVGQPFTYGNTLYSITKIDRVAEVKDSKTTLKTTGTFIEIFLSVTNQGQEPVSFQPSDFTLIDSQGKEYTLYLNATAIATQSNNKNDLFDSALQPGLEREGVLVFETPKQATGLILRLSNGYADVSLGE
jgi:hypothetical protein